MRLLLLSLALIAAAAGATLVWRASTSMSLPLDPPAALPSETASPSTNGTGATATTLVDVDRVALARGRREESVRRLCAEAGVKYPPQQLFLRAFKHEAEIEAWCGDGNQPLKLVKSWQLTARSGDLGPKRREGDRQIPEGCYRVIIFNPKSNFHLSMGLDYPNASDRVLSDAEKPGHDIYIHGNNMSIGCLAIGDDMIEELYLLAADFRSDRKDDIPVHIFPARMRGDEWNELRSRYPQHTNFWGELEPIYRAFEDSRRVPAVKVDKGGSYAIGG